MIQMKTTENLTGVTLEGTHEDLYEIYEAISRVLGHNEEDTTAMRVLGVCYDLRHTFMGHREVVFVENHYGDYLQASHNKPHGTTNLHYSVNILWLELLFTGIVLESYLCAYEDTRRFNKIFKDANFEPRVTAFFEASRFEDIALVRLFQQKIWSAFAQVCGQEVRQSIYKKVKKNSKNDPLASRYTYFCCQYLDQYEMLYLDASKKERKDLLIYTAQRIISRGGDYQKLKADLVAYSKANNVWIGNVRLSGIEYPHDIKW